MKKKFYSVIFASIFILLAVAPTPAKAIFFDPAPAPFTSEKIAKWGTGEYRNVIIKDDLAICAADAAGFDILDVTDPSHLSLVVNHRLTHEAEYIFVLGDYLYITGHNLDDNDYSLSIVDISDRNQPEVISTINDLGFCLEVKVVGDFAYLGCYGGLKVFNISDPADPVKVGWYHTGIAPMWLDIQGDYAFMANIFRGFQVIDISNPEEPTLVTTNDTVSRLNDIVIRDNLAFVSSEKEGLAIFDISNPEVPCLVGKYDVAAGSDAIALAGNGRDILLTDRENTLYLFSVDDPANPEVITTFTTSGTGTGVAGKNNLVFISEGNQGLETIDLSDPEDPQQKSHYDHSGVIKNVVFNETHAFISDRDGIKILDISTPSAAIQTAEIKTEGPGSNLFLAKNHLYIAGDRFFGLKIIDISDPNVPIITATLEPEESDITFKSIDVVDNYAYICASSNNSKGKLYIYDISNPAAPDLVCELELPAGRAVDITIENDFALITAEENGLIIIDISNPLEAATIYDGSGQLVAGSIACLGNFAYIVEQYQPYGDDVLAKVTVFDITNPEKPNKINSFSFNSSRIYDLFISDNCLNVATDNGLDIYSLKDRQNPQKIETLYDGYEVAGSFVNEKHLGIVTGYGGGFILYKIENGIEADNLPPDRITAPTGFGQGFASTRLSWQTAVDNPAGAGIGGYRIFRDDYSKKFPYATAGATATSFVDPSCEPGESYTYTIQTFDKSDNAAPLSSPLTIWTKSLSSDNKVPTAPAELTCKISREKVKLSWMLSFDADSGVEKYEINKFRLINNNPFGRCCLQRTDSFSTNYIDTDIIFGAEYEYQVRAVDYAGNISAFSIIKVKVPANPQPEGFSYFLPHFCAVNGWDTDFSITNITEENANVVLQAFAADGRKLVDQPIISRRPGDGFPANHQLPKRILFRRGLPPETAWLKIDSNKELSFVSAFESPACFEEQRGVPKSSLKLLFPVLKNSADSWTGIAIANPGERPVWIMLKAFDENGNLLRFSPPLELPAFGQVVALVTDLFAVKTLPGMTATIIVEATAPIVGLEDFSLAATEMAGLTAIPAGNIDECSNGDFHYSIINDPDTPTEISLVNLSSEKATVTIFYRDLADITQTSESLTIPGNGKFDLSATANASASEIEKIAIISSQPLSAISTAVTLNGVGYAATCAFSRGLDKINFSYLRLDGRDTGSNTISIANLSRLNPNRITFQFFQGDGELLLSREQTIPAGGILKLELRDFLGSYYSRLSNRDCWVKISGELPINGFYSYRSVDDSKLTIISVE